MPVHALKMVTFIFLNVCLPAAFTAIVRYFFFVVINIVTAHDGLFPGKLPFALLGDVFTMVFCVMKEYVCACTCF